jgi:nucleoside-diphosphate-sugar epimerase
VHHLASTDPCRVAWTGMRVFLAGGTGAVGKPLVAQLVAGGHEVTVFSRSEERVAALGSAGVKAAIGDALNPDTLIRAVQHAEPEVVINQLTNLAQTASPLALKRGFAQTSRLRREASSTLVRAARAAGARRVIAQSISFVYRPGPGVRIETDPLWTDAGGQVADIVEPITALEGATLGAEGLESVVLRYGAFYGPGTYYANDGAFSALIKKRRLPIAGQGRGLFGFVHIDDAARATLAALEGAAGVFNVVDDVPAASSEWIAFLAGQLGAKPPRRVPLAILRLGAGAYTAYLMDAQPAVSNHRARTELGWEPTYPNWHTGLPASLVRG